MSGHKRFWGIITLIAAGVDIFVSFIPAAIGHFIFQPFFFDESISTDLARGALIVVALAWAICAIFVFTNRFNQALSISMQRIVNKVMNILSVVLLLPAIGAALAFLYLVLVILSNPNAMWG